jgi:hypothetical protein
MMGEETAWNMYSIDSNKQYCITLHLVGYTLKNINNARSHERQKTTVGNYETQIDKQDWFLWTCTFKQGACRRSRPHANV